MWISGYKQKVQRLYLPRADFYPSGRRIILSTRSAGTAKHAVNMERQFHSQAGFRFLQIQSGNFADAIQSVVPECVVYKVGMPFEDQRNYRVSVKAWNAKMPMWTPDHTLEEGIREIVELIRSDRIKNPGSPIYSNEAHIAECYHRWL